MEENKVIEEIIHKWSVPVLRDIIELLNNSNVNASGKLINELKFELKNDLNTISLSLVGPEYLQFVLNGRKPGKMPPVSKILEWTQLKGLPDKAAFPIARNIGKFGIKPFRAPLGIIYKNMNSLKDLLAKDYGKEIKKETVEILKNIKLK